MNTVMPVIIPVNTEPTKTKCPECGHEWVEKSELSTSDVFLILGIVLGAFFSLHVFFEWVMGGTPLLKAFVDVIGKWIKPLTNLW